MQWAEFGNHKVIAEVGSEFAARQSPDNEPHERVKPIARKWLRGWDLNPRPSGYEPDELPGCSTPRFVRNLLWPGFANAQLDLRTFSMRRTGYSEVRFGLAGRSLHRSCARGSITRSRIVTFCGRVNMKTIASATSSEVRPVPASVLFFISARSVIPHSSFRTMPGATDPTRMPVVSNCLRKPCTNDWIACLDAL
jgi:hypothetical protein